VLLAKPTSNYRISPAKPSQLQFSIATRGEQFGLDRIGGAEWWCPTNSTSVPGFESNMLWIMGLVVAAMRLNYQANAVANVTVIEDIKSAFRGVTNDTELVNHIIPEMYGASMRSANPSFVFKMPRKSIGGGENFELLTMQRSDFAEPIFPNISQLPTVIDSPTTIPPETSVKTSLIISPQLEWLQMGLEGWTGELKPPVPWLEQSHK